MAFILLPIKTKKNISSTSKASTARVGNTVVYKAIGLRLKLSAAATATSGPHRGKPGLEPVSMCRVSGL